MPSHRQKKKKKKRTCSSSIYEQQFLVKEGRVNPSRRTNVTPFSRTLTAEEEE
jgi:hypothetical protein